jgi:opine dehydrogenase
LETGFSGGGAMLHPIPSYMNINKIDAGESFDYYMEGITPSIAKLISAADKERLAVCKALGLNVPTLAETLKRMYNLEYDDLFELIQHNKPYEGVKSPASAGHRFMVEDVACGIVPLASIGCELGVETPVLDAFIEIACVVSGRNYKAEGRTAEKLGLKGKTLEEIYKMI